MENPPGLPISLSVQPQKYLLYTFKSLNFVAQIVPVFLPHALSLKFVLVLFINAPLAYCFWYFILFYFIFLCISLSVLQAHLAHFQSMSKNQLFPQ